jgi:hypothetical protein
MGNVIFKPYILLSCLIILGLSGCASTSKTDDQQQPTMSPSASTAVPATNLPPGLDSTQGSDQSSPTAGTSEDKIVELDGKLDESIAVFDSMILEERGKAEAIDVGGYDQADDGSDNTAEILFEEGDLSEGLPGYGEFPGGQQADQSATETTSSGTENGETTDGSAGVKKGQRAPGSNPGGIPEDIDEGSDDDIVARQIREAALKEKDPVLREKLWAEYRKYKNQRRADS